MTDDFAFAMVDMAANYGQMLELYQPLPQLTAFYDFVASAAQRFDGCDAVRSMPLP